METISLDSTRSLRNLYFVRTAFQVVWAAGHHHRDEQPQVAAVLFLLYPLWDVACTVYDLNTFRSRGSSRTSQIINAVLGVAAAIGIGLTVFQASNLCGRNLWLMGVRRRCPPTRRRPHSPQRVGGRPMGMILSGAQSIPCRRSYFLGGLNEKRHIKDVGGYAVFGALYFLIGGSC